MSMAQDAPSQPNDAVRHARAVVQALYVADLASQSLGIELVDVAPGQVQIAMTVRPDMINGFGMCHGGIVFAFADTALWSAPLLGANRRETQNPVPASRSNWRSGSDR